MRRLTLLLAGGAVWLFLAAIPVFADAGPHVAATNNGSGGINADSCAGCHRAHTAQGANLLIQDESTLCLACHGTGAPGSSTDVSQGVQYSLMGPGIGGANGGAIVGALRDGGFTNARIGSGSVTRVPARPGSTAPPYTGSSRQHRPALPSRRPTWWRASRSPVSSATSGATGPSTAGSARPRRSRAPRATTRTATATTGSSRHSPT